MHYDHDEIASKLYDYVGKLADRYRKNESDYCLFNIGEYDSIGVLCNELAIIIVDALQRDDKASLELQKQETIEYKGYKIDVGVTYAGHVSVQYLGDDVLFKTVWEAKDWIDSLDADDDGDVDDEEYDCEDDFDYWRGHGVRSSTGGDYGPSNPWDAPGMSMSDFI